KAGNQEVLIAGFLCVFVSLWLILLYRDFAQRRVERDQIPAAIEQGFRMRRRIELVIRNQSVSWLYGRCRPFGDNRRGLKRRTLDSGVHGGSQSLRQIDSHI